MATPETESSAQPEPSPADKPRRRRRWPWIILGVFGGLIVLLGLAALYLQSGPGFRQVMLPLAARLSNTHLEASEGRISFGGRITARDFVFEDSNTETKFAADRIYLHIPPFSLFGDVFRIETLEAEGATIVIDTTAPVEPDAEDEEDEPGPVFEEGDRIIPVSIGQAVAEMDSFIIISSEVAQFEFTQGRLTVENLSAGETGRLGLQGNYISMPGDERRRRAGVIDLNLQVAQNDTGTAIEWDGDAEAQISEDPDLQDEAGDFTFTATTEGELEAGGGLATAAIIKATDGERSVGTLQGNIEWVDLERADQVNAHLLLESINSRFINPWLAALTPAQFVSASIDGHVDVETNADRIQFVSELTGRDLSLRLSQDQEPTPPLEIASAQKGAWNQGARTLVLETADLQVQETDHEVIAAHLTRQMELDFSEEGRQAAAAAEDEPAEFNLQIDDLTMDMLRPWVAIFAPDAMQDVRSGSIDAELATTVAPNGRNVAVRGSLDIAGFKLQEVGQAEPFGPVEIEQRLEAAIEDLERVQVASLSSRLIREGTVLLTSSSTASYALDNGALEATSQTTADNFSQLLRELRLLTPDQAEHMRGGAWTADSRVVQPSSEDPLQITGTTRLGEVTLLIEGEETSRTIQRTVEAEFDLATDQQENRLQISQAQLQVSGAEDGSVGEASVEGEWPMGTPEGAAAGARTGRLDISVAQLDLDPWMEFMGVMRSEHIRNFPVTGNVQLESDPSRDLLVLTGEEEIGPILVSNGAGEVTEVTLVLANALRKEGDRIPSFSLDYRGIYPTGAEDRLRVEGSATLGERPNIVATANVPRLDISLFMNALFSPLPEEEDVSELAPGEQPEEVVPPPPEPDAEEPAEPATPVPVDLNVTLNVAELVYNDLVLQNLESQVRGAGGDLTVLLEPVTVGEGALSGQVNYDVVGEMAQLDWNLAGERIPMTPFATSLPWRREGVEGTLTFTTEGSGRGMGNTLLASLNGQALFEIDDGKFGRSRILDFIADQTGVDLFRGMRFNEFDGRIDIADNKAQLVEVEASSAVAALVAEGYISFDRYVDIGINPRVGPTIAPNFLNIEYINAFTRNIQGLIAFPIKITITGPFDDIRYGVRPAVPGPLQGTGQAIVGTATDVVKTGGNLVQGLGNLVVPGQPFGAEDEQPLQEAARGAGDVVRGIGGILTGGLIGGRQEDEDADTTDPAAAAPTGGAGGTTATQDAPTTPTAAGEDSAEEAEDEPGAATPLDVGEDLVEEGAEAIRNLFN